jgi:P4 family phage/plasmid primase-like protien
MSARDPFVCIIPRSNVYGWPPTINKDGRPNTPEVVSYLPLSDVLVDDSESDIHFTAYSVTDVPHRLTKGAEKLIDGGVNMVLLVYDVDCPKSLRVDGVAPDKWWDSELLLINMLLSSEPELLVYRTRGGYRIVGRLEEPFVITDQTTTRAWSEIYVLVGASLHLRYGIRTDPKCRDWQHLQRCPHALRTTSDGKQVREPGVILGDTKNVGAWNLDAVDFPSALEHLRLLAADHKPWGEALRSLELATGLDGEIVSSTRTPDEEDESAYEDVIDALLPPVMKVGEGGGRHSMYLALSGVLYDRGVPGNVLPHVIGQISIRAGVDEARLTQDRIKGARSTVARAQAGGLHTRIGSLVTYYPEVAEALDRVLPPKRAKSDEAILRALTRKKAEPPWSGPVLSEGSDLEVAEIALYRLKRDHIEVIYSRSEFWMCNSDSIWIPAGSGPLELKVHELDGAPYGQKGSYKANQGRVTGAVKRAATLVAKPTFFDEATPGIAFQNGFLQVSGAEMCFEELTPLHCATTVLPFHYDPAAECPRWERFLTEVFRDDEDFVDKITLLRQFVGACLVGAAPKFQASLVLEGGGDNGKSVFLHVVSALFPAEVRAHIPPQKFEDPYYIAKLAGVRVNIVAETPRTDLESTEGFKKIVSGDVATGRKLRENPFNFIPILGNIFACQKLPGTSDQSHGFWKRWLPVKFGRKFLPEEMDRDLKDKIIAEEMPGIARWAVKGALEALSQGNYSIPASTLDFRERWRKDSDQVSQFAEERLSPVVDAERWAQGSVVYRAYREWAQEAGHKTLANNHFAERLEAIGYTRRRNKGSEWNVRVLQKDGVGKVFRSG